MPNSDDKRTILITLPSGIVDQLTDLAKANLRSRNAQITVCLRDSLARLQQQDAAA